MGFVILFLAILSGTAKVILQSRLTRTILSNITDIALYNAIVSFGIGVIFFIQNGLTCSKMTVLFFALAYSIFNSLYELLYTIALKCGPVSITAMLSNFSLVFTVLFGVLYFHETLSFINIIGFIFFSIALIFSADLKNTLREKISMKWFFATIGTALAGAATTITRTVFGKIFDNADNATFLTVSSFLSAILLFAACSFLNHIEKRTVKLTIKNILSMFSVSAALSICLPLMLHGIKYFPSAVFMPVLCMGIITIVSIIGIFSFRDRLEKTQITGLVFGTVSILLLTV